MKQADFEEISYRVERPADYEGYAAELPGLSGGVQFAEVTVDVETGVVKVARIVAVHDGGRPINPKLVESQIYGGVIQGVSYALYEERHLDSASGQQLNANVDQYKIVGRSGQGTGVMPASPMLPAAHLASRACDCSELVALRK